MRLHVDIDTAGRGGAAGRGDTAGRPRPAQGIARKQTAAQDPSLPQEGEGACVGEGIACTVAPTGNADVYADTKYRQNLMVYLFTCPAEKLDEKHEALV